MHDNRVSFNMSWGVEAFIWIQMSREADHTYIRMNASNPHGKSMFQHY